MAVGARIAAATAVARVRWRLVRAVAWAGLASVVMVPSSFQRLHTVCISEVYTL